MTRERPGPKPIHTPEVLARLVELRKQGHSWPDCGAILGLNWKSLRDKLYRSGVKAGGKRGRVAQITPELMAQGVALRAQGKTWAGCGDALGLNGASLRSALARAGIKAPGRLGAEPVATPERIARARELRAQGMCWKLIERQLGVSGSTLAKAISKLNKAKS